MSNNNNAHEALLYELVYHFLRKVGDGGFTRKDALDVITSFHLHAIAATCHNNRDNALKVLKGTAQFLTGKEAIAYFNDMCDYHQGRVKVTEVPRGE